MITSTSNMTNQHEDVQLCGKKKLSTDKEKVIEAIKGIHRSVGWNEQDDAISVKGYKENGNISVFAMSKDGSIIGYTTARPVDHQIYYLSFIAVDRKQQSNGIGRRLLFRVIEKVKKRGGQILCLDYEDSTELNKFYLSDKIPYSKNINYRSHQFCRYGHFCNDLTYDLN